LKEPTNRSHPIVHSALLNASLIVLFYRSVLQGAFTGLFCRALVQGSFVGLFNCTFWQGQLPTAALEKGVACVVVVSAV